jgi:hypothetical protein
MRTLMSVSVSLLLAACFLIGSGCSGNKDRVVSVAGTVTHNGHPVPGLVVSFVPNAATETGVSTGQTDDNGKYELTVVKTGGNGAVVGTHKVWVSRPREPFVEPGDREKPKKQKDIAVARPPADLTEILKKYGNLEKTPLTVEVKGGEPIDLKLD